MLEPLPTPSRPDPDVVASPARGAVAEAHLPTTVIEAGRQRQRYWHDMWRYRELLGYLAWRDITIKYKQTLVGFAWHFLRPLMTIAVFTLVFGRLAGLPSGGPPYPLLVFAALLPWQFFNTALQESSNSIVANAGIVAKLYFPRLMLPLSAVAVAVVDLVVALGVLLLFMLAYRYAPSWRMVALPVFILPAFAASLGAGLWLSALLVRHRDIRYVTNYGLQLGMYLSPIGFSSAVVPERWRALYALNPMVSVIDGFRWAILGTNEAVSALGVGLSFGVSLALLVTGAWYFRSVEASFVDHL